MTKISDRTISVIGLGYVGLPLAAAFAKKYRTIAFDINPRRIEDLRQGKDRTLEVAPSELRNPRLELTHELDDLRQANFHIVAVPTPVDAARRPDLGLLLRACESVGKVLKKGDIVVYESTVYPGATEEECLPILEKVSGLKAGRDFKLGYSPERINPGDKERTFTKVMKIISGQDAETLDTIASIYGSVVEAGVYRAESIKIAEAAKVIENTQRDLNIALMNELALIFHMMNIDTSAVLNAASTKWNFARYSPGLVGGHCIGVDPYYLTHKAEKLGYHPQVILAGRRLNDGMGRYVARMAIKRMIRSGHAVKDGLVTVLGIAFKENCRDTRNTRVIDIIEELRSYDVRVQVCDPCADPEQVREEYGVELIALDKLKPAAALIAAVAHDQFRKLGIQDLQRLMLKPQILLDVKGIYPVGDIERAGIALWRL